MAEDALTAVTLRNKFYKDGQRRLLVGLLISFLVNVILAFIIGYEVTHPPQPKYFATSINGRVTPLFPLTEPNQPDSAVLQWANEAAIAAFSYNFVNYREELQASSGFFTPDGWQQFLIALQQSNNLEAVKQKKLIVSAVATRAPSIIRKEILDGRYTWNVRLPLLVTYQSANEFSQQNNIVTMLITRVSILNSPRGIGIAQFVVAPAEG